MAEDAAAKAESALLAKIAELAEKAGVPGVVQLAEAYAWVTNPGQPHGGSSQTARRATGRAV